MISEAVFGFEFNPAYPGRAIGGISLWPNVFSNLLFFYEEDAGNAERLLDISTFAQEDRATLADSIAAFTRASGAEIVCATSSLLTDVSHTGIGASAHYLSLEGVSIPFAT